MHHMVVLVGAARLLEMVQVLGGVRVLLLLLLLLLGCTAGRCIHARGVHMAVVRLVLFLRDLAARVWLQVVQGRMAQLLWVILLTLLLLGGHSAEVHVLG